MILMPVIAPHLQCAICVWYDAPYMFLIQRHHRALKVVLLSSAEKKESE